MSDKYSICLQYRTPELVGSLWLNHSRGRLSSVFSYAPAWLQSPHKFALSPDLPLNQYNKACDDLFLCFQDCSPDRWGKVLLLRQEIAQAKAENRKPRTLLESDYLLKVSDFARQGAIRISADDGKSFLSQSSHNSCPPLICLPKLLSASQKIHARTETDADLQMLVATGSSLGGARPKASVLGTNDLNFP